MLIVNADDWGLRKEVTDAILECRQAGAVTSASAMVGMADSGRAFELAAEHGLPIGLHLNLTTPLDAAKGDVRADMQRRAVSYFAASSLRRRAWDPSARRLIDGCVADQLDSFELAWGATATHLDGHEHIHVCPTVLTAASLGRVVSLRRAHGFVAGQGRTSAKRAYRAAVNLLVRRRFRSVPFMSLRDLHPSLGGDGLGRMVRMARDADLEVMVHPGWGDEREVLLSAGWRRLMEELPTGSHADLP